MDQRTLQALLLAGVFVAAAGVGVGLTANIDTGFDNPAPVSDGVPFGAPNGFYVTLEGNTSVGMEKFTNGTDTVVLETTSGNVTAQADGVADITLHTSNMTGPWTNVTDISASLNPVTIDPEDKQQAVAGGDIDRLHFRSASAVAADDGTVDFFYAGTSGTSRVTISGAPASTTLYAIDAQTGTILDKADSDGSGTVTFDSLENSEHNVVLQTGVNKAPTLSDASPQGMQNSQATQFTVDVNDSNFAAGDTVEVVFSYEGSEIDTQTISSNQTVSTSAPAAAQLGGAQNWSVEAADDFGGTASESYMYSVPQTLEFRNEAQPHGLIKNASSPIQIEAVFFEDIETDPAIIDRTTTNGKINLTGLPVGSEFSVSVSAPGYNNRTVRIESIFEQSNIFLLEKSATTVENRFIVNDRTGSFPPEDTEIIIQAPVDESEYQTGGEGFVWRTVSGDDLGADEAFVADLEEEKRYRILVTNEQGDQRNLGSYVPEVSGTIELNIGSVNVNAQAPEGVGFNATYQNTTSGRQIAIQYNDTADATEQLIVNIYERNNESNTLIDNESFSGPFGTYKHIEPVPAGDNETTWVVEVEGVRGTDSSGQVRENVEFQQYTGPGFTVLGGMPDWLITVIFVGVIWGVAGTFSQFNGHVGGIVVAGLGAMFFFVGVVPAYLGGGVVALSLLTAGILFVRGARGGGL